ncbi:hypothetical protein FQN52_003734 [Onygenales sp. PD_12]|nr:hypothetical protein FQN52_003734 [Onygenales sp. PD_12]
MPVSTPPTKLNGRNIAIAALGATAFGYYILTRSRAKGAKLIQPEERERFQGAVGQEQTSQGSGKTARAKDIPRSGGS